jgi:hypothetical protein
MSSPHNPVVSPHNPVVSPLASVLPAPAGMRAIMPGSSSHVVAPNAPLDPFGPHHKLPDNEHDALYLAAPQTWAERNPSAGVQKQRLRGTLTDAGKATKRLAAERNKARAALLAADIDKFMDSQQTQIEKIARDHSRQVSDIRKLVNNSTNYHKARAPSLANALTHKKTLELNEGIVHRLTF